MAPTPPSLSSQLQPTPSMTSKVASDRNQVRHPSLNSCELESDESLDEYSVNSLSCSRWRGTACAPIVDLEMYVYHLRAGGKSRELMRWDWQPRWAAWDHGIFICVQVRTWSLARIWMQLMGVL